LVAGVAVYMNYSNDLERQIKAKSETIEGQLPEIVSRLALLLNAGMILKEAWALVADSDEGEIFREMQLVKANMMNGVSDYEAIFAFGQRCENAEVRKFSSRVLQSIEKGGAHLSVELSQQALEMFELKRQIVRRKTDEASQKLLIPLMIMFIGILALVLIPIMTNLV
jgi:tight adherence protein C